jgi:hypothetical protein
MMSYATSVSWSHPVLSYCYTEHGQRHGVTLPGCITTVAISRSGPHILQVMMAHVLDVLQVPL